MQQRNDHICVRSFLSCHPDVDGIARSHCNSDVFVRYVALSERNYTDHAVAHWDGHWDSLLLCLKVGDALGGVAERDAHQTAFATAQRPRLLCRRARPSLRLEWH